jgi:phage regulator Rha-like protein
LFESKGLLISTSTAVENAGKGRPDKSYLLNEQQFVLLVMLAKNSHESIELKSRLSDEFFRMREELAKISTPSPYIEQVRKLLLLDAPTEWVYLYPPEFYTALMQSDTSRYVIGRKGDTLLFSGSMMKIYIASYKYMRYNKIIINSCLK